MNYKKTMIGALTFLCVACEHSNSDSTNQSTNAHDTIITVGVFMQEADDSFVATDQSLVYTVGVYCEVWSRNTYEADEHDEAVPHLHYNAADSTYYDGWTFGWTEYGPEHTEADIIKTCEDGFFGEIKTVNSSDFNEDHPGVFLKIVDVVQPN